jgi:hypothetical protein
MEELYNRRPALAFDLDSDAYFRQWRRGSRQHGRFTFARSPFGPEQRRSVDRHPGPKSLAAGRLVKTNLREVAQASDRLGPDTAKRACVVSNWAASNSSSKPQSASKASGHMALFGVAT